MVDETSGDGLEFVIGEHNSRIGKASELRPGRYTPEALAEEIERATGWPTKWDGQRQVFVCDLVAAIEQTRAAMEPVKDGTHEQKED